ncbi:chorismate lyase [Azonexus sp.]|uniref:chorismate--pyruvate lyase family protein n=1 Tax=Azonexus sp. TaxID=1872668 RepID=UPI002822A2F7|nr:chorismate lyase [Azonexus sp.]MDR1994998.1 chorismate lyase [Azonexus sp.]
MSRHGCWRPRPAGHLAPVLRRWLTEPDSLTARCQCHCREFRIRPLCQARMMPLAEEERARGCLPVREVLLECDGVPVVFAHSALSTVRDGRLARWFAGLGSRSLGSLLFAHPGFRREPIEYCRLFPGHPLHRRLCALSGRDWPVLWARRSRHYFGGASVLVCEVFLPALMALPAVEDSGRRTGTAATESA